MDSTQTSGYVQVYTGDGKGKTTAALGLALRAAGAGWKVLIAQFAKATACSELRAFEPFSGQVVIRQFGRVRLINQPIENADIFCAQQGLAECKEAIVSGDYRLVILDEANVAVALELFSLEDLLHLIDVRPKSVELLITGRWAHSRVIERADLVTEMREIKHYYRQGVLARLGIEN